MHHSLRDGWTVHAVGGPVPTELVDRRVPATVPGCVHTDLLAAGLIPDPYLDENEAALSWIGHVDWCYETSFDWDAPPDGERVDLVVLGLDTVATVRLNGTVIAETANMHRSYRVPIGERLRSGPNALSITFAAGVDEAYRRSRELGPRPHVNTHPYNAIRKMAANYGWDWGPDVVTAGIWRPIALETWRHARLASVRPLAGVKDGTGTVDAHVAIERATDLPLTAEIDVAGRRVAAVIPPGEHATVVSVQVDDVELWWPHDLGAQPLYPTTVTLRDSDVLDRWNGRIGFRTVEIDTDADDHGTQFALRVNGVPLFTRGVNWIPDDCFPSRIGRDRYAARLGQARAANVNLVRVWGGGLYESEDFYRTCDEIGLLVWQDFLFACAAYAEEEPLRSEVIAEAREAVTRLCPHPSLAVWNGGNETIWGHADWGWRETLGGHTWGLGYYTDVLPGIVAELDPMRPYVPSSPCSPSPLLHPNDPANGTTHLWDVWNQLDYTSYRDTIPRFVAEFGFQGPPSHATTARAIHDDPLLPDSPGMLAHQKADQGQDKLERGLKAHLPVPADFDDWHWATALNQARAVAFGIEHLRSCRPVCMGAVMWQLNDCWPVTSWSAVDGDGRRKPVWYAMRRSYRDRLLTVQPRDAGIALVAVNDGFDDWDEIVHVRRVAFDGTVKATTTVAVGLVPGSTSTFPLPDDIAAAANAQCELVVVDHVVGRALWSFVEDIEAALPAPDFECRTERVAGGYRIVVTARTLLRDLTVFADRLAADAVVDDMLVTLLPGESVTFEVQTEAVVDATAFSDPKVLRTANQLIGR